MGAIGFPKMFRKPLCRNGAECFTVPRHENRDFMQRLSKMQ